MEISRSMNETIETLKAAGIRVDESRIGQQEQLSKGIQALIAAGAILAAGLFALFIETTGLDDYPVILAVLGLAGMGWGVFTSRKPVHSSPAFSAYLLGGGMFCWALGEWELTTSQGMLSLMLVSLLSLLPARNYLIILVSVLVFSVSLIALLLENHFRAGVVGYYWVLLCCMWGLYQKEALLLSRLRHYAALFDPVRLGVIGSLLGITYWHAFEKPTPGEDTFGSLHALWLAMPAVLGVLAMTLYLLRLLAVKALLKKAGLMGITVSLLLLTLQVPAVGVSLYVVLLSFRAAHRTGVVLGSLSLLYAVARLYYDLQLTLLVKSWLMMGLGMLFLGIYWLLHKNTTENGEN